MWGSRAWKREEGGGRREEGGGRREEGGGRTWWIHLAVMLTAHRHWHQLSNLTVLSSRPLYCRIQPVCERPQQLTRTFAFSNPFSACQATSRLQCMSESSFKGNFWNPSSCLRYSVWRKSAVTELHTSRLPTNSSNLLSVTNIQLCFWVKLM